MPKVPQYSNQISSQVRQVSPQSMDNNPYNFGKGVADDAARSAQNTVNISKGLSSAADVAFKIAEIRDTSSARDAYNSAHSEVIKHMGALEQLRGKDGISIYDTTEKAFNDIRKKYIDMLDSRSKDLFTASFDSLMNDRLEKTMNMQNRNILDYDKVTKTAMNESAIDDAVTNYADDKIISNSKFTIEANTRSNMRGTDKETQDKAVKNAINDLHLSVAESITSQSPSKALAYMDKYWNDLDPSTRDAKRLQIKDLAENEVARDTALALAKSGLPFEQQMKQVEGIKDVTEQKKVKKLVEEYEKDRQSFAELNAKQRYEGELDAVYKDPFKYQIPLDMPADQQNSLYTWRERLKQDAMANQGIGDKTKTNFKVWYELNNMPADQFQKVNLTNYMKDISTADLKTLANMQKSGKGFAGVQTPTSYVNEFVKAEAGKDNEKASFLREAFETALNTYPQDERKKIETLNKVKDALLMEFDWKGESFGGDKKWEIQYKMSKGSTYENLQPEDTPDFVPKGAVWTNTPIDGMTGWEYTNPLGVTFLITPSNEKYIVRK